MYGKGHTGLTLAMMSWLMVPFGWDVRIVLLIIIASGVSTIPDKDIQWHMNHRGPTHTVLAAVITGIVLGVLFYLGDPQFGLVGFLGGFFGVISHLLGDIIAGKTRSGDAYTIKPFWPFSNKEIGFGLIKASNRKINGFLINLGGISFVLYVLITRGVLQSLLRSFGT